MALHGNRITLAWRKKRNHNMKVTHKIITQIPLPQLLEKNLYQTLNLKVETQKDMYINPIYLRQFFSSCL